MNYDADKMLPLKDATARMTRVYTKARVWQMFKDAHIHGKYIAVIDRENIEKFKSPAGVIYFNANQVDDFLRVVIA